MNRCKQIKQSECGAFDGQGGHCGQPTVALVHLCRDHAEDAVANGQAVIELNTAKFQRLIRNVGASDRAAVKKLYAAVAGFRPTEGQLNEMVSG